MGVLGFVVAASLLAVLIVCAPPSTAAPAATSAPQSSALSLSSVQPDATAPPPDSPAPGTYPGPVAASAEPSAVRVSAHVSAVRLLVVDDGGCITEIFNNTGVSCTDYEIRVRVGSSRGPLLSPAPEDTMAAYVELEPHVNWSERGLVYSLR